MKKILFALLVLFCAIPSFAQNSLTFKGIPVEGRAERFVARLKAQGCILIRRSFNEYTLAGSFTSFKNCMIIVSASDDRKVASVSVLLPEQETWSGIERQYFLYKDSYIAKYGNPVMSCEDFETESDGIELRLLNSGKCHYATLFELKGKGRIAISIVESGYMQPRLGIVYVNQDEISHQRLQMFRDI